MKNRAKKGAGGRVARLKPVQDANGCGLLENV